MLTYDLSKKGDTPLYEFIYKCIKNDILSGAFEPNDKLPSKRTLADNLSVSLITIENAYSQLIYEGYIYSVEKKGYFVSDIGEINHPNIINSFETDLSSKTNASLKSNTNMTIDSVSNKEKTKYQIDFESNHPDKNLFPFTNWAKITRKTLLDKEEAILEKSESQGCLSLRISIAKYLKDYKGMNVSPDNIIIGAGMEYLYSLILHILGRNKMIAVEDPGHTKVSKIYESNGVKVIHVPLDSHGFNLNKLGHSNVSCVHISPSHHFPTGIVMPASRRHKLIDEARSKGIYLIEDDYDSELRYEGKPLQAMAALAPDKVIYMNTFTKTLMNCVRIAYMVLPDELMLDYTNQLSFYSCTVSSMEQYTLSEFMNSGHYERHINRMRLYYKKCRKNFLSCFEKSNLPKHFEIIENNAGLHFLIKAKNKIDDNNFIQKLEENGIKISSLSSYCFRPGQEYEHQFLINYFSIAENELIKIFNIMAKQL